MNNNNQKMKINFLLPFIFIFFVIIFPVGYYLLESYQILFEFLKKTNHLIEMYIDMNYSISIFILFLIMLISIILNFPGNSLKAVISGYYFGIFTGSLIAIISITLGSFIFYNLINKKIIRSVSQKKTNYEIFLNKYLNTKYIWVYLFCLRLLPIIPLPIQNLIISSLDVSRTKFLATTFLGVAPLIILYVLIGSQLSSIINIENLSFSVVILPNLVLFLFLLFIAITSSIIIYLLESKFLKNK